MDPREKTLVLRCGHTTCYLVRGRVASLLVDTGAAGSLGLLGRELKAHGLGIGDVDYLLATHYHPDHMGIARDLGDLGVSLLLPSCQVPYVHQPDHMYLRDGNGSFHPVREGEAIRMEPEESRAFLGESCGIDGQVIRTPGHSPDSVSLVLDSGEAFVGDLCPLEQAGLYQGGAMESSWEKIIGLDVRLVYFAHWPDEVL